MSSHVHPHPRFSSSSSPPSSADADSTSYDANNESSPSPPASSSSTPLILYSPPTVWGLLRGAAINLILPFINGLMLGFGELLAHEAAFRFGWSHTRVFPKERMQQRAHPVGPGVELRDKDPGRDGGYDDRSKKEL